jgi:hypothetical protein
MSFMAYSLSRPSMPVLVVLVVVLMVMMLSARRLGVAGAAGKLVYEFDELVRRGMVLARHIAGLNRDRPVLQDRQFHFRLHVSTPF